MRLIVSQDGTNVVVANEIEAITIETPCSFFNSDKDFEVTAHLKSGNDKPLGTYGSIEKAKETVASVCDWLISNDIPEIHCIK